MLQFHFPEEIVVACCRASPQLALRPSLLGHYSSRLPATRLQLPLARAQMMVFADGSHRLAFRPERMCHFRITNSTYPAELEEIRDVFVITSVKQGEGDVLCAWTICHLFAFDTFDDTPTAMETRRFHQCFQGGCGMPVDCNCDPPDDFD